MARNKRDVLETMAARMDGLAYELERQSRNLEHSAKERTMLDLRARERRACAQELRLEAAKVTNDR